MRPYFVLWSLGCVVGIFAAIAVLYARQVLSVRSAAAVAWALFGFVVGAKWHMRLERYPFPEALWITPGEVLEHGFRLPLGLLVGAVLAGLWCVAMRVPWREVGDSLAVGACTLIAVGRLGCISAGCCVGKVCGSWGPFCRVYPAGSQTYFEQVNDEVIREGAAFSLAAHPLPFYSQGAALLLLAILLWLLWRGAAPGMLLGVFVAVRPLTKLLLETFRNHPRESTLMVGVPLAEIAVVLCLALYFLARTRRSATQSPGST